MLSSGCQVTGVTSWGGGGTIMDLAGLGNAMTLLGSTLLPMNTIHESVTFSISCRTFENPL